MGVTGTSMLWTSDFSLFLMVMWSTPLLKTALTPLGPISQYSA